MTVYSVTVKLDNATLDALENGFQMQVYKGVKSPSAAGALPTVWLTVSEFSSTVTVSWSEKYGGYFSNTVVKQGAHVDTSTREPMRPGDVITLSSTGSSSVATTGGVPGAFSFQSDKNETWTCGLMVDGNGEGLSPVCAFPVYGAVGNVMMPYQKVLILFTQLQLDTGSVVETAVSESVSILLSSDMTHYEVSFDIYDGWKTDGTSYQTVNPKQFDMAPDLIVPAFS